MRNQPKMGHHGLFLTTDYNVWFLDSMNMMCVIISSIIVVVVVAVVAAVVVAAVVVVVFLLGATQRDPAPRNQIQ